MPKYTVTDCESSAVRHVEGTDELDAFCGFLIAERRFGPLVATLRARAELAGDSLVMELCDLAAPSAARAPKGAKASDILAVGALLRPLLPCVVVGAYDPFAGFDGEDDDARAALDLAHGRATDPDNY